MRRSLALALLFSAASTSAEPVITSVAPNAGPVAGGTEITIKGSGFNDPCAPPKACPAKLLNVYFGHELAATSTLIDPNTITATTPAHLPGSTDVSVCQADGCAVLHDAFLFVGDPDKAFARLLFPIFLPPTAGAFGSNFVTAAFMWNPKEGPSIPVYGLLQPCPGITCAAPDPMTPFPLAGSFVTFLPASGGTPGRLLYVPKNSADAIAANLRVFDTSLTSSTAGTEIPVVRDADFRTDFIALLGVPWDANYRNTLRIYSAFPEGAQVRIGFGLLNAAPEANRLITLTPGSSIFEPATAVFTDFPAPPPRSPDQQGIATMSVAIAFRQLQPSPQLRIWAFVSSTNNTTQQITIISPH